jgi:hypothetical protein
MSSTDSTLVKSADHTCWLDGAYFGLGAYYATSLVVLLGVAFGAGYVASPGGGPSRGGRFVERFLGSDSRAYGQIARDGYEHGPGTPDNVPFFPALPLAGRAVVRATSLPVDTALLLVVHVALACTFVLLAAYVRLRCVDSMPSWRAYTLLALGLLPSSIFFRMVYSESLFLLAATATLYSHQRRWPLPLVAAIVGFGTATRPVGVALLVPLAVAIWQASGTWRGRVLRALWLPVGCWGLGAFLAYQWWRFGDGLAFVRAHEDWGVSPPLPWPEKTLYLLSLKPLWCVFVPSDLGYWGRFERNPLFSLQFANPIFFAGTAVLIAVGAWRRWLNAAEWGLGAALLLIPYVLRAQEMHGGALARFAAAVLPAYFVLGHLLARLPAPLTAALCALSAVLLAVYSALFAAGYPLY